MKSLNKILKYAEKYIKIINEIGNVDVELVDPNGVRVIGTGNFNKNIGEEYIKLPKSYENALREKKQVIISDVDEEFLDFQKGKFNGLLITPILADGMILGILNIFIRENLKYSFEDTLKVFLCISKETTDFLSIKFKEKRDIENFGPMISLFEILVRNMEEGAIVINDKNEIQIINQSAKIQLGIERIIDEEPLEIIKTGDSISDSDEFKIKIGDIERTVIGTIFNVEDNRLYNSVLLFKDIQKLQSNIYDMTSTVNIADMNSIIGSSDKTKKLKKDIIKVSKSISTVLISGESGTGKEMVATAIWKNSDRKDERFVAINCAAIPEALLESELFGYVKGAFTNADPRGRMGKFELADKGVIFLDEIGDMPLYLQSKLLRVIQERKISRIGSNQVIPIDVRIIAATNQNLREMIIHNTFREDLYYRLNVIPIEIPPLRERKGDIRDLFYYFVTYYGKLFGKTFKGVEEGVQDILLKYPWPGNVRELENAVEYMVNMMENGMIKKSTLPKNIFNPYDLNLVSEEIRTLEELENKEIKKALDFYGRDTLGKEHAAKALGIGIATLYRKIQKM